MSRYLVDRIRGLANVEVVTQAQISALEGRDGMLEAIQWRVAATDEDIRCAIRHLFLFIGADPNSDWLAGALKLDRRGFILTGPEAGPDRQLLETSSKGIFAIGDVRAGSVKRVAAAVGEGAQVVAMVHGYLAALGRSGVIA
jgi:thioredoxin reductase (NADPH)